MATSRSKELPVVEREAFEKQVYLEYFIRQVEAGLHLEPDTKAKAELLAVDPNDPDDYDDDHISAMWFGWRLAFREQAKKVAA